MALGLSPYKESPFYGRTAFISLPVIVDHLQLYGNKLYLSTGELLPDFYHSTSTFFADLLTFINGMEYFAVGSVFLKHLASFLYIICIHALLGIAL